MVNIKLSALNKRIHLFSIYKVFEIPVLCLLLLHFSAQPHELTIGSRLKVRFRQTGPAETDFNKGIFGAKPDWDVKTFGERCMSNTMRLYRPGQLHTVD